MRLFVFFFFICSSPTYAFQVEASDLSYETVSDSLGDLYLQKATKAYNSSFDLAYTYLEQSFGHYQNGKNWKGIAICYVAFSSLHLYQGDYLKRDSFVDLALNIAEEKLDQKSLEYASILNSEASRFRGKGNYAMALEYFKKVLSINQFLEHKVYIANTLANMGDVYVELGDYEEALTYYKEAYQYHLEANGASWRSATIGIKIGSVFKEKNNLKEAANWYTDAEKILMKESKTKKKAEVILKGLSPVLFHLADIALEQGDLENAFKKVEQAQKIRTDDKVYTVDWGRGDDILGKLYLQQNDFEQALNHFFKSRKLVGQELESFEKHPLIAKKLLSIADVYQASGKWDSALQYYHLALEMVAHGFKTINYDENPEADHIYDKLIGLEALKGKAENHFQLFQQQETMGDLYSAHENYQLAFQLIAAIRQVYLRDASKEQLSTSVLPLFEGAIQTALTLYKRSGEFQYLQATFSYIESNKAIGLLESINEIAAMRFSDIPDSLLQKEKRLSLDIAYYEKIFNEAKQKINEEQSSELERRIFNIRQEYNALIGIFEKNFPKYFQLKYKMDIASIEEVQKKILNESSALIEYFVGVETVYVFVITRDDVQVNQFPKDNDFVEQIKRLRSIISHPPSSKSHKLEYQEFIKTAYDLYQQLIPSNLNPSIDQLILVQDDLLCLLPFDILLTRPPEEEAVNYTLDELSYLLETFDVSYSYSTTLLLKGLDRNENKTTYTFAGFAPSFETPELATSVRDCNTDKLYSLLCSQNEVMRIQELFGGNSFLGENADVPSFKLHAPESNIIHLATHACVDETNHQFNKIYFADDYLSNNDLYHLFFQADLAVLSACNTGAGQLIKGEGVMSLSRGFIHAGCSSTVMSLWSVNDCATSDIMVDFYRHLKNGQAKNQALKQAKLDFLKASKKAQNHPYYWAAFVQFGNTERLLLNKPSLPNKINLVFILIILGIALITGVIWNRKSKGRTNQD